MYRFKRPAIITVFVIVAILFSYWYVSWYVATEPSRQWVQPVSTHPPVQPSQAKQATKEDLLKLVNEERAKVGVAPLTVDPKLQQSAQWKADKITETGTRAHKEVGSDRNDGLDYLDSLNPDCSYISENIRWNDEYENTTKAAIKGWLSSEAHRKAMLSPQYETTGFGVNGTNIVQHFCVAK